MRILITIVSVSGLIVLLSFWATTIGIPLPKRCYVFEKSHTDKLVFFSNEIVSVEIKAIPEVLDRIILKINFTTQQPNLIVGKIKIKLLNSENGIEIPRIFTIKIYKQNDSLMGSYDEITADTSYSQLDRNSKYRSLTYIHAFQFSVEKLSQFTAQARITLIDTLSNQIVDIKSDLPLYRSTKIEVQRFMGH